MYIYIYHTCFIECRYIVSQHISPNSQQLNGLPNSYKKRLFFHHDFIRDSSLSLACLPFASHLKPCCSTIVCPCLQLVSHAKLCCYSLWLWVPYISNPFRFDSRYPRQFPELRKLGSGHRQENIIGWQGDANEHFGSLLFAASDFIRSVNTLDFSRRGGLRSPVTWLVLDNQYLHSSSTSASSNAPGTGPRNTDAQDADAKPGQERFCSHCTGDMR